MLQTKAEGDKVTKADVPRATATPARPEAAPAKTPQAKTVASQPAAQRAAVTANASKPTA